MGEEMAGWDEDELVGKLKMINAANKDNGGDEFGIT
jgi:hypothetical protein